MSRILFTGGVPGPGRCLLWGVPGPGGCLLWGGTCSQGVPGLGVPGQGDACSGGYLLQGVLGGDPQIVTAAGSMHPTGMHSCYMFL